MAKKKLYFYEMKLHAGQQEIDYCSLKKRYQTIFDSNCRENSLDLTINNNDNYRMTMDIIRNTDEYLFCRVGKEKENNGMLVREYKDLTSEGVLPDGEEDKRGVEITTYFYINYRSAIVAFVSNQSAPTYQVVNRIFTKYAPNITTELLPIVNPNGVDILLQDGGELSKVAVEIPIPDARYLDEVLGMREGSIQALLQNDIKTVTLILQGEERHALTNDTGAIKQVINKLHEMLPGLKKAKISGKTPTIKMQEYDLMEQFFSYYIDVKAYRIENGRKQYLNIKDLAEEYSLEIRASYEENKDLLLALIARHKQECE